jgi:hypothetical protein
VVIRWETKAEEVALTAARHKPAVEQLIIEQQRRQLAGRGRSGSVANGDPRRSNIIIGKIFFWV